MRRSLFALAALLIAPADASAVLTVRNEITMTRPDGSAVAFPQKVRVWCGRWDGDAPERAVHVRVGGRHGHWELRAVIADVRRTPVVELPNSFVFDEPDGADLFAAQGGNELSSSEEESSGRIVIDRVRCGRRLAVRFHVDGVLGSEFFEGDEWTVRGSFSARR